MSDLDHIINQARAREDATTALLDQIPVPVGGWDIPPAMRRPAPAAPPPECNPWRELLLWVAWQEVLEFVCWRDHPVVAEPRAVYGLCMYFGRERVGAALFSRGTGDTLAEAGQILEELLDMACEGRRPRTGLELGLRPEMFEGGGRENPWAEESL